MDAIQYKHDYLANLRKVGHKRMWTVVIYMCIDTALNAKIYFAQFRQPIISVYVAYEKHNRISHYL